MTPGAATQRNLLRVFRAIDGAGEITQSDLVDASGLATGAVSALLGRLIDTGLVEAESLRPGGRGRPQRLLRLADARTAVAAAQINGTSIVIHARSLNGAEVARATVAVDDRAIASVSATIRDGLASLLGGDPGERLLSTVVAFPGIEDSGSLRSMEMRWEAEPVDTLRGDLAHALRTEVQVENDGQLATLAEWTAQTAPKVDNVAVVLIEAGIGGGIVAGGHLLQQPPSWPGLGHAPVVRDGVRCPCGNRGCLETVASLAAIAAGAGAPSWSPPAEGTAGVVEKIVVRAADGDPDLLRGLDRAAVGLGALADTAAALIGTERIILTGTGARLTPWLTPEVVSGRASAVTRGTYGADAVIEGALLRAHTLGLSAAIARAASAD
ncbi:MAG: ROK family transcriptional regulator [Microbacterium sp.]|uniref:ROK family transcriptional regulator n=1 Tax=Microbacterium sp. TaxID=51671 RepID=UPI001AC0D31A|nr:ROK family transcriptional regulator [Microbacterium sp.]MBN9176987.1 ROK family transcriptional regulator [Microbacterium sp.]